MLKKIFLLALISIAICSCSTYNNGFSKKKYYDFSNVSSAVTTDKTEKSDNQELQQVLSLNSQETLINSPAVASSELISVQTNNKKEAAIISNSPVNNNIVSKAKSAIGEEKFGKKIIQMIKQKKEIKAQSETRKGKYWWVWGIIGIVFLILSLFVSAYIFFFVGLFELTFGIIELIKYKKSK